MTREEILARAKSALDKQIRYSLGCGGWHPGDALPARKVWRRPRGRLVPTRALWCDCSGFVSWVIGLKRNTTIVKGLWGVSTVSIHRDATGPGKYFRQLAEGEPAEPGDLIVYPDRYDAVAKKTRQGHVAIIVDVEARRVIDCASSVDGVSERVAGYWDKATVVRYVEG